jgi:hypothetical protein
MKKKKIKNEKLQNPLIHENWLYCTCGRLISEDSKTIKFELNGKNKKIKICKYCEQLLKDYEEYKYKKYKNRYQKTKGKDKDGFLIFLQKHFRS